MTILHERFPFIRDDLFLEANVDTETGKQKLKMVQIDLETGDIRFSDEIECIHAAVLDIPVENFDDTLNDPSFPNEIMRIRSSENLKEIKLPPEEKFKAFKSWIAGIAEAGIDAFKLQADIECSGGFMFAVSWRLMRFLALVDPNIMLEYLSIIERDCRFEGERHEACLIANLVPILDMMMIDLGRFISESSTDNLLQLDTKDLDLKYDRIIKGVFSLHPPLKLFLHKIRYAIFLKFSEAAEIPDFRLAFNHKSAFVKKILLLNPKIAEFPEFLDFFSAKSEPDPKVRAMAAHHPQSADFKPFKKFLSIETENSSAVRAIAAAHSNATNHEEYINLLSEITEPRSKVRKIAASHPNAVKFPEYKNFLSYTTESDPKVRVCAAENENALDLELFKNFLSDDLEPNTLVRIIATRNFKKHNSNKL